MAHDKHWGLLPRLFATSIAVGLQFALLEKVLARLFPQSPSINNKSKYTNPKHPVLLIPGLGGSILNIDHDHAEEGEAQEEARRVWVRLSDADASYRLLFGRRNAETERVELLHDGLHVTVPTRDPRKLRGPRHLVPAPGDEAFGGAGGGGGECEVEEEDDLEPPNAVLLASSLDESIHDDTSSSSSSSLFPNEDPGNWDSDDEDKASTTSAPSFLYPIDTLDPDLLLPIPAVQYYAPLIHYLTQPRLRTDTSSNLPPSMTKYRRGVSLFGFGYDYRQSSTLDETLDALERRLDDIQRRNGGVSVNVVAHSMGGLLIAALRALRPASYAKRIHKVITIATPFHGCGAYTMDAIVTGVQFVRGWESIVLPFIQRETMRQVLDQSPSMYELLPHRGLVVNGQGVPIVRVIWGGEEGAVDYIVADGGGDGGGFHAAERLMVTQRTTDVLEGWGEGQWNDNKKDEKKKKKVASKASSLPLTVSMHDGDPSAFHRALRLVTPAAPPVQSFAHLVDRIMRDNTVDLIDANGWSSVIPMPFDQELYQAATRTRQAVATSLTTPPRNMYAIYGSNLDTPYSVCYGTQDEPVTSIESLVSGQVATTWSMVDGDGSVPSMSARGDGLSCIADVASYSLSHRGLLQSHHVFARVMSWLDEE